MSRLDPVEPGAVGNLVTIKTLTALYLAATAATLPLVALERDDWTLVDSDVGTQALLVFGFALLLLGMTERAAKGMPCAYRQLRILAVAISVFSVALVVTPGLLPLWMKLEQGLFASVLAGVALVARGRNVSGMFDQDARAPEHE